MGLNHLSSKAAPKPTEEQGSLFQQIKLARVWLPVAIVGVVLLHQLVIVPLGNEPWQFWSQLLFYSILGPSVTYLTLNWIASEVKQREGTQNELKNLYQELQKSHALLGAIQKVTEQFAAAPDLESSLVAASEGIADVTGASGAAVFLGSSGISVSRTYGLGESLLHDAQARARAFMHGLAQPDTVDSHNRRYWVLSMPLTWGGRLEGSIHAYYTSPPGAEQRESFSILCAEFSAAAEATHVRTRDLLTLFEVDRSIRAEGNLERLLETLLTQMMTRAEAPMGAVYLATEEHLLQLRASHGIPASFLRMPIRVGEGFIGGVAEKHEARIIKNLSTHEKRRGVLQDAASAVALPLESEGALLGVVVLAHTQGEHFKESSLPFLRLLAGQVSLAVRNAQAYFHSEELAIAEERARIAREIHDGVAQSLAFSALKLDLVGKLLTTNPDKAAQELMNTKTTLRELIKEVRRSIFALRPIELEQHGFTEVIRRYSHDFGQQNELLVEVSMGDIPQLSAKSEAVLFRIFQEAMNNVAKHAFATKVTVTLGRTDDGDGFVQVTDDGRGFDLDSVSDRVTSAGGLGLRQMRERIEARGGSFEIVSSPGNGTQVTASIPE